MKNIIIKNLSVIVLIAIGLSCADESLDPLQSEKVKKGTLLALRGDQLDVIYFDGADYGAAFFADDIRGNETFEYDAEFLSEDKSALQSVDIFVIKRTETITFNAQKGKNDTTYIGERVLLTNIPFAQFKTTDDYAGPWVSVSLSLSEILIKIAENPDPSDVANFKKFKRTYKSGIEIESDLNLTGGAKVLSSDLVSAGLYESDQFYPAQRLVYGVESIDDAKPKATLTQRGQYNGRDKDKKKVFKIIPLKDGAKDTLLIQFDQQITAIPTVTVEPSSAGTLGPIVKLLKKNGKDSLFYVPFVAASTFTGDAVFTVTGATSAEAGSLNGLVQKAAEKSFAIDNLAPANTSFTTGIRVGKAQSAVITLKFNEALSVAPKVSIAPGTTQIDAVTDAATTLSTDGLTATYTYEYKDSDNNALHGNATVSVSGGKDRAGNDVPAIASKPLTIDIGAAPAPSITLDATQFDWGTQVKWTINYATGGSNPEGSTSGTVYYVAQTNGKPAPTGFVGGDVPAFTMAEDPASSTTPKAKVAARQTGTVAVTEGTSGSVYSVFAPNGMLDVYVVFVSSTGVISAISAPTNITMN